MPESSRQPTATERAAVPALPDILPGHMLLVLREPRERRAA